jgi:hypothetical protein
VTGVVTGVSRFRITNWWLREPDRQILFFAAGMERPRSVPLLGPPSGRPSVVVLEDTAQSFPTLDSAVHVDFVARLFNQLVPEPLMIPLEMVVLRVLLHRRSKVALAQWNDLGERSRSAEALARAL